jgi:3-dehydroquinate synthase II
MPATQEAYARAVDLAFPVLVHEHATTWGEWKEPTTDARYIVAHGTCPRLVREQRTGATYAVFYELQSAEDVHALEENLPCRSIVMVETKDWELIPVENLVSVAYQRQTSILVVVSTTGMAEAQLASLERGVHGVILATGSASAVESFASLRNRYQRLDSSLVLDPAVVVDVREAGVGERVCLDTCLLLAFHEGFLVGSSASTLALVLSEAAQNPYVASRPFRVNAGAVHSYILVPDGSTKYLCELRAGDELLAVDARSGRSRSVTLGRAKIERRPLLLVQLSLHADGTGAAAGNKTESWSGDIAGNVIVQNAETVRFAMPTTSGTSSSQHGNVAVTSLNRGQHQVLVHRPARDSNGTIARHLGRPVQEFILEQ